MSLSIFSQAHRHQGVSLAPLKRMALSARVVTSEHRPQPPSVEPLPVRAEEELAVVAAAEASGMSPPPVLSVRNVVPTLTSNKRQGLSLNGRS
jgi:hypothetical protein